MLAALIVLAAMPDLVPARWISNDPKSLDLIRDTPVNCLLIEQPLWSVRFNDEAAARGFRPSGGCSEAAGPALCGRGARRRL